MQRADASATILDVARLAGVSATTVSNVVNNKHHLMREETRERVRAAIKELGYRPFTGARSMRQAESRAVGVILVDPSPAFLTHPAHAHIVAGLSNHLNERGYRIVLQGVRERDLQDAISIKTISTDAICAILSGAPEQREHDIGVLSSLGQPVVLFHERPERAPHDALVIRADEAGGGAMLAEHLLERGCRRLVMLIPSVDWPATWERVEGVRAAVRRAGLPEPTIVRCGDGGFDPTQAALSAFLDRSDLPDAFMAGHDQIGIAAMMHLTSRGIRMPQDVSITGFNAFEFRRYTAPILTSVRSPAAELGQLAGQHILERLRTGTFALQEIVAPVQLLEGGTTTAFPETESGSRAMKGARKPSLREAPTLRNPESRAGARRAG